QGDSFNVVQQYVIGTQLPALGDERHFALADGLRFPIEGSLVIVAVRNSVRPNHLFDHNRDHDYFFALPCGSGAPNQFDGDLRHTMTQFRATPRVNRTSKSADNPIPYATSSTAELTVCGPSLPWRWHGHAASRGAETDAARLAHNV